MRGARRLLRQGRGSGRRAQRCKPCARNRSYTTSIAGSTKSAPAVESSCFRSRCSGRSPARKTPLAHAPPTTHHAHLLPRHRNEHIVPPQMHLLSRSPRFTLSARHHPDASPAWYQTLQRRVWGSTARKQKFCRLDLGKRLQPSPRADLTEYTAEATSTRSWRCGFL